MLALASPLAAQTITDPTALPAAAKPAKPDQQRSPFTLTAAYTSDALANLSGGVSRGANYVDLLKLSAAYDGAGDHDGLTTLLSVEHFNGSNYTGDRVGGIQAASSSEARPSALRLDQAWVQQELWSGAGDVKAGLVDINTSFDVQETATLFLNASHGIGPDLGDTGRNGPADYPNTALAIATVYRPAPGWTA